MLYGKFSFRDTLPEDCRLRPALAGKFSFRDTLPEDCRLRPALAATATVTSTIHGSFGRWPFPRSNSQLAS